ncbi:MAG: transporter substrate-binding domain-containing protein [Natronospirillum sp.]|uniref:substrate-binding periplasmic protein n=1 Tax=Natronospirillum sp. TaxID=2812955 RepID=UPI0025F4A379|nr:transporter substrate-binding domain-containing protein [Natronospirillum sp.]MCH8550760.1 transporter substrate-binding domain-containing protein [Natronospirillum sp.]
MQKFSVLWARLWLLVAAVCSVAYATELDRLTFITEEYPPYNFERHGQLQGYSIEVLATILDAAGSAQSLQDVRIWPWARGYETVLSEPDTVLFSTTRTPAREDLFHWVGPLALDRVTLIAPRDAGIRIDSISSLNDSDYRIAVIREDIGAQRLLEAGVDADLLRTAISNTSALSMLEAGRVDLWAYGEDVARWLMAEQGVDPDQFESVYTLSEAHLYFAINRDTDHEVVDTMQALLDELRAAGEIAPVPGR